jgi:ABC-type transport system involved in cytochrome c biogenesis ATPase subunit
VRLRYLHLPKLPPLEDITIRFGYEPVLGRAYAMHFVVGVNGTGKSRLLRALAEIFLCMERGIAIPFAVTLVYDFGPGDAYVEDMGNDESAKARLQLHHTICLHRTVEGQTTLIDFDYIPPEQQGEERDWEALSINDWIETPLLGYHVRNVMQGDVPPDSLLPKVLLAYTSGAIEEWEMLFASRRSESQDLLMTTFNNLEQEEARQQERPPKWDNVKELELKRKQAELYPSDTLYPSAEEEVDMGQEEVGHVSSMGIFVPPTAMKLAICAVVLKEAVEEFRQMRTVEDEQRFVERINLLREEGRRMSGLRGILNEIDWLWPVTIGLHIVFRPELLTRTQIEQLVRLYEASSSVVREPEPGMIRRLFFDLREQARDQNGMTIEALIRALTPPGNDEATAFDLFRQLLLLQQQGILEDITIVLRKRTLDDLILYDGLSDGEQVFLGRMAFFHLLKGTEDALILLDEPETHFNDFWKREMVDIIDSSLRDDPVEVLLSTHSSIALTDAFDTEIVLLYKEPTEGKVYVEEIEVNSFGASPIDIMRKMFHAPESVGQRAAEFLDLLLMVAVYHEQVQRVWAADKPSTTVEQLKATEAFIGLRDSISKRIPRALSRDENPAEGLDDLLLKMLRSVRRYTQWVTNRSEVNMIDALDALHERLGPGYYQFEFRRRLDALRRNSNAPSD